MSFAADAIGFYLQLDDQLSPKLLTASANYAKFVKDLDQWNKQAYQSATKGIGALASLLDSFDQLPKNAAASYHSAVKQLRKKMKPLSQRVNIEFTPKTTKEFGKAIGATLANVLRKVRIRSTAAMPLKRGKLFDTTVALRSAYKDMTQPPDLLGSFQGIPRFQAGGIVEGPNKAFDSVIAALQPGEAVVPKEVVDALLKAAMSGDLNIDPEIVKEYGKSLGHMTREEKRANRESRKTAETLQDVDDAMVDTTQNTKSWLKLITGTTGFLAVRRATQDVSDGFGQLANNVTSTFSTLEGDKVESFVDNLNQMNQQLGLSRAELREFKRDAHAHAVAVLGGAANASEFSEAMESLTDAGMTNRQTILDLAPAITLMAKATNAAHNDLGELAFRLTDTGKLSKMQVEDLFATVMQYKHKVGAAFDVSEVMQQMTDNMKGMGKTFVTATAEQQQAMLANTARTTAALSNVFGEQGGVFSKMMSDVLAGDVDAINSFQKLTGMSAKELQDLLMTQGADLDVLFDRMAGSFKNLDNVSFTEFRKAVADTFEVSELANLVERVDEVKTGARDMARSIEKGGHGLAAMRKAAKANQTVFEKLTTHFTNFVGELKVFGVTGVDVIDFFKELNPVTLLAAARSFTALGGFSSLASVFGAVGSAAGVLFNPITLVVAALVAVGAGVVYLLDKFGLLDVLWAQITRVGEIVGKSFEGVWVSLKEAFGEIFGGDSTKMMVDWSKVADAVLAVAESASIILGMVLSQLAAQLMFVIKVATPVFKFLVRIVSGTVGVIVNLFTGLIAALTGDWATAGKSMEGIWMSLSDMFMAVVQLPLDLLVGLIDGLLSAAKSFGSGFLRLLGFEELADEFGKSFDGIIGYVRALPKLVAEHFGRMVESVMAFPDALVGAWDWIKQTTTDVLGWLGKKVAVAVAFYASLPEKIVGSFLDAWDSLKQTTADVLGWLQGKLVGLLEFMGLDSVADNVSGIFDGLLTAVKAPIATMRALINQNIVSPLNKVLEMWPIRKLGLGPVPMLAQGGIVTEPTVAVIGEAGPEAVLPLGMGSPTPQNFRQQFSMPMVSKREMDQAVRVELDPNTTDKPVREELQQVNATLKKMVSLLRREGRAGEARPVPGQGARVNAGPSNHTRDAAAGEF